jgi:hypothetical protein
MQMRQTCRPNTAIQSRRIPARARVRPAMSRSSVLRVSCPRCDRVVEIQKTDAVRLDGEHAIWKDVGMRLLDNTCRGFQGVAPEGCRHPHVDLLDRREDHWHRLWMDRKGFCIGVGREKREQVVGRLDFLDDPDRRPVCPE